MASSPGIGHNRPRDGRTYAILFEFDTEILKLTYPNTSWNNAYSDVISFPTSCGFNWTQGSACFGDETVDAIRCVRVVQRMAKKFPWFTPAVRDIRMLRIEENSDLKAALIDEDD